MSLGQLQETVTVTGEAPAVDVRSASTDAVLKTELLESIPAVRSPQGYVALTPGMTAAGITSVVTLNTTYGPGWQRPTLLQGARFLKLSGQIGF